MPDTHNEHNEWEKEYDNKLVELSLLGEPKTDEDAMRYYEKIKEFIGGLLSKQETALRKEWAGKVRELKKEVKNVPHGDSNSVRRKKAFNAALKQVLALIEPEI